MDFKDYYATLGIPKAASADEIQKAYRKLARKYHPDVNRDPKAEERFKDITESYEVLKDPEKRQTYDRFGADWKSYAGGSGAPPPGYENVRFDFGGGDGSGFSSFFDMLFNQTGGGGRGGRGGSPFEGFGGFGQRPGGGRAGFNSAGQDQEAGLALSLEEAAQGGQREITLTDPMTGRVEKVSIQLPPGVKPGQKIRLAGRGGAGLGSGPRGNLYLKVDIKPHRFFRLEELDVYSELAVTPWDAALGGDASVKTLGGSVKVKIPAGSSTGRKIRLRGRGFPNPKGPQGDHYAEIKVVVPEKLTRKERKLFEELAEVSDFRPS